MCSYVEWQKRPSSCTVNINLTMIIVSTESSAIVATVFLWTCSQCMAAVHTAQTNFTTGRRVATSYMTLQSYSKIQCLKKCFDEKRHNRCSMAGYDLATRTCFLSNDAEQDLLDADENVGVFFYSDPAEPLLKGINPVPDSYFTATSQWNIVYVPHYARLDGSVDYWCASTADRDEIPPTFYIQVRFHNVSTVVRVATKGGSDWVTLYRLAYSQDCANFTNLLDGTGNNVTFPANTDATTVVKNQLPTPITALCLRLHPLGWNTWPELKMEVYGWPAM